MATIQDLRALALQIRDADEDRENTALKVGQFLYDLLGYLDTKADLTPRGPWSKQLSFSQTPIVALQSVEAIPDSQGQNNKMWWSSDDGKLKWKANDEVYPLGNPTYILYYCGNKIYRWGGSSTGFTKMEASGGASSITAFTSYVVKNSTSELPSSGNPATGYIVGTHIYAYVGSHGDTADGKYQDLGELNAAGVSLTTNGDGTFTVHAGGNDYTVNLNHTHENMAKLIVCEESDLPSTLDEDTIYGVNEDGELSMLYVGGIPFYGGGGGGTSTPVLRQPADGSTIDVGTIESGQSSLSKTITVKGKNLTQALTVAVTGTGYSVNKQSISAADANAGTTLEITCTNTDENAAGTLSLASSEVSCDCDLVANVVTYEDLAGVKLTGSQWLQTDYYPNPNTEFELELHFIANSATKVGGYVLGNNDGTVSGNSMEIYTAKGGSEQEGSEHSLMLNIDGTPRSNDFSASADQSKFFNDHVVIKYEKAASDGIYSFIYGSGANDKKVRPSGNLSAPPLKSGTSPITWAIGYRQNGSLIFNKYDLVIYRFVITEGGSEVRHWVPKTRNGVPGLYDTVTGTFISSQTSTELVEIPLT